MKIRKIIYKCDVCHTRSNRVWVHDFAPLHFCSDSCLEKALPRLSGPRFATAVSTLRGDETLTVKTFCEECGDLVFPTDEGLSSSVKRFVSHKCNIPKHLWTVQWGVDWLKSNSFIPKHAPGLDTWTFLDVPVQVGKPHPFNPHHFQAKFAK